MVILYKGRQKDLSSIYICENICDIDNGLEAIQKKGTIIRTEIRVRLGQIIPVNRRRSTGAPTQVLIHCIVTGCDRSLL